MYTMLFLLFIIVILFNSNSYSCLWDGMPTKYKMMHCRRLGVHVAMTYSACMLACLQTLECKHGVWLFISDISLLF